MSLLIMCLILSIDLYSCQMKKNLELHKDIVNKFFSSHQYLNTSKLGTSLFKNKDFPLISPQNRNKTFTILMWKHWEHLQKRYLFHYGSKRQDPLEGCSVSNCVFTGDDSQLHAADAVVVHLHRGEWPQVTNRNRAQRWIFLSDEPPKYTFILSKRRNDYRKDLNNVFNWSMTYASEADVPVPYGRIVPLDTPMFAFDDLSLAKIVPNWKDKQRHSLVAILFSRCLSYRRKLIADLKKYSIKVDAHGNCGEEKFKKSCPGHYRANCPVLSQYLFYLSLENSKCKEYMTEKLFDNAYYRGAIPIIQGPSLRDCETFLPPHSYLHVDNYAIPKDLADDIIRISKDDKELLNYHWWRNHFKVANEHGFLGRKSFHLCRVCEAMNYNDDTESVYSKADLARYLDEEKLCRK